MAILAVPAFAFFTCGFGVGLLVGLVAGLAANGSLKLGESWGRSQRTVAGKIVGGSANVFTNGRPAVFVEASSVACDKHSSPAQIAEGSTNVFIRDSRYVGQYLTYSGLHTDKITIQPNAMSSLVEWKEEDFKDYPVRIYVSNVRGKNADKLSKTNYIKMQLREIPGIFLLREQTFEI